MLVTAGRTKPIANSDAVKVICPSTLGILLRSCSGILSRSTPSGIRKTFFLPTVLAAEYVRRVPGCVSFLSFYTCLGDSLDTLAAVLAAGSLANGALSERQASRDENDGSEGAEVVKHPTFTR